MPSPEPEVEPVSPFQAVFEGARTLALRPGMALFHEGDASERVILLASGRVKIATTSADGVETVLAYRGPGAVLGELAAVDGGSHVATVSVVEPGEALVLPAGRFIAALGGQPGLALDLLRAVVARLREADLHRAEFATLDVAGRVAKRLLELAAEGGEPVRGGIRIRHQLSQRELAGWVGASREAVNKALAQMDAAGVIVRDGRSLVVASQAGLEAFTR